MLPLCIFDPDSKCDAICISVVEGLEQRGVNTEEEHSQKNAVLQKLKKIKTTNLNHFDDIRNLFKIFSKNISLQKWCGKQSSCMYSLM